MSAIQKWRDILTKAGIKPLELRPRPKGPLKAGLYDLGGGEILEVTVDQDSEEYKQKARELWKNLQETP